MNLSPQRREDPEISLIPLIDVVLMLLIFFMLSSTFVDEGRMMWVQDGQLRSRTSAEYIGGFKGTPAADEAKRVRKVLMTDVTGDVAIAKVELDYPDGRFVDYFTLARLGSEWKIIHKTFQRFPKAPASR